jgi:hypothetical protein
MNQVLKELLLRDVKNASEIADLKAILGRFIASIPSEEENAAKFAKSFINGMKNKQ